MTGFGISELPFSGFMSALQSNSADYTDERYNGRIDTNINRIAVAVID